MTYKLVELDKELDKFSRKENYQELKLGEKMRCAACNSIYWRLFYDRAQCMGCKSLSRFDTDNSTTMCYYHDLRDVTWIKWQVGKYADGRVRDPLRKRSEFVVFKNLLKCRVGGTELLIHPQLKGYWFYGKVQEEFKTMTTAQILAYLKNNNNSNKGLT
jgi:hypothetical protein